MQHSRSRDSWDADYRAKIELLEAREAHRRAKAALAAGRPGRIGDETDDKLRRTDDDESADSASDVCECQCAECEAGNCADCSDPTCTDENCTGHMDEADEAGDESKKQAVSALNKLALEYARIHRVSFAVAYEQALTSPRGQRLYAIYSRAHHR